MNRKDIFYQDKDLCNIPFTHIEDPIADPSLTEIDELYGAADVLSMINANMHYRILLALSVLGTLMAFAFLVYDVMEIHGLILACVVLIVFLFYIRYLSDNLESHRKYLQYRVLAESLRVQYFLSIAGINVKVIDILPWFIEKAIPWVAEILNSLPTLQLGEKRLIIDCWIRDQKTYHENALMAAENKYHRHVLITKVVLFITVMSYIVALVFEIFIYNDFSGIDAQVIRMILKIVLGTMSAIALFSSSYYGKMSLANEIDDHNRMISLYEQAENDISQNGETEEILMELAREFLIENSTWYSYQNKNNPDFVF